MILRRWTAGAALVTVIVTGAVASSRSRTRERVTESSVAPPVVLQAPPTTSPTIALSNLEGEIRDREKRAAGGDVDATLELVARYLVRAKYEGRVADLVRADDTSRALAATRPDDARAQLTRASALGAIHEFGAAAAALERAAMLGADAVDVRRERSTLRLAVGQEEDAEALVALRDDASPAELAQRAGIVARLGQAAESERLFTLARQRYRDVSPFAVAWMDFERSRALELGGDRTSARAYLAEAATVMPTFTHAVVHLAANEPPDHALARLRALEATSDDPDVIAGEADALRRADRGFEAAAEAARARARFDEVLARLPLAYADHAASFFLGMGHDPARALALAATNARNRPTAEAVELWLTAAQAAQSTDGTCAAAAAARRQRHPSPELRERAIAASRACP